MTQSSKRQERRVRYGASLSSTYIRAFEAGLLKYLFVPYDERVAVTFHGSYLPFPQRPCIPRETSTPHPIPSNSHSSFIGRHPTLLYNTYSASLASSLTMVSWRTFLVTGSLCLLASTSPAPSRWPDVQPVPNNVTRTMNSMHPMVSLMMSLFSNYYALNSVQEYNNPL